MKSTRNITFSAIVLTISFICLYMTAIIPSAKLACLCAAASCICIIISEAGLKFGIASAAVISVFAWFFVPDKSIGLFTVMFFSNYPIIKLFAEKKSFPTELIIKILYFILITALVFFVFKQLNILPEIVYQYMKRKGFFAIFVCVSVIVLFVFDFALSMIISFYTSKIMSKRKNI